MLWQDCGSKFTSVEVRCGRQVSNTSVAKREAEKWPFGPSGVKTPEGNADFMSCLKARPTKHETFSAICLAAEVEFGCGSPHAVCTIRRQQVSSIRLMTADGPWIGFRGWEVSHEG